MANLGEATGTGAPPDASALQQQIQEMAQNQANMQTQMQNMMQAMTALNQQLTQAQQRAEAAEKERADALRLAVAKLDHTDIVDAKGVGQPFKLNGKADQDFAEWDHKVVTFLRAKFGEDVEKMLKWAVRQRKVIVAVDSGEVSSRTVGWDVEFGDIADDVDRIENAGKIIPQIYTYLISFTVGAANKVVRNAGTGQGLEAWRRLHNEYDPTSAMRRVTILGMVQNPQKVEKIEDLGKALEDGLSARGSMRISPTRTVNLAG